MRPGSLLQLCTDWAAPPAVAAAAVAWSSKAVHLEGLAGFCEGPYIAPATPVSDQQRIQKRVRAVGPALYSAASSLAGHCLWFNARPANNIHLYKLCFYVQSRVCQRYTPCNCCDGGKCFDGHWVGKAGSVVGWN
jgi:hypothetical protein